MLIPGPMAVAPQQGPPSIYSAGSLLNNGRYRVRKRLNKGATAVVYAGEDLLTGRPVALKVVQCCSNKVPLNVVRREVSLSSSVAHENMVQLLDVFAEGTELIIVWELISGGDLLELLNECGGCMTETAAAFYYAQLLRGVLHMHAVGYCHRDIKPENCMIEAASQRLKLIDFGLSKHLESVATLGVGTPDYMCPEMVRCQMRQQQQQARPAQQQQQGLPPYDAKAVDAWAMGVLLYLLVTGCYPFEDPAQPNNLAATLLNVQAGRCQPLPEGISAGCREVIRGLLNPDPQRRTRLEDLAYNPWLLQSAAAHATKLGPLGAHFDPGNPLWILPSVPAATPAAAPATTPAVPTRHSAQSSNSTSSTTGPASPPPFIMSQAAAAAPDPQSLGFVPQHRAWDAQHFALAQHTSAASTPHFQHAHAHHHHQAMAGTQSSAGHQHQTSAAGQLLQGFGSDGSLTERPQVATGHMLRQQLAVHSAPGVPGQPLTPGLFTQAAAGGGVPLTGYSHSPAAAGAGAGAGMGHGWGASTAQSYAYWLQQQQGRGMTPAGGISMQQQHVGYAGSDGMDVDPSSAADGWRLGQFGHGSQQQQHYMLQDSRVHGRDQGVGGRVDEAAGQEGSSKERKTGFLAGLQSLVRKR